MDLRQLRYFVSIVDGGSFAEAARRLHVVQSALSQRLAALEDELGTQLLVRGRSGVVPTEAGTELYYRAQTILKQVLAASVAVQEKAGIMRGSVAIGLLRSTTPGLAARLFQTVRSQLPEVVPNIAIGYSVELGDLLRTAQLDIALQSKMSREESPGSTWLYSERLCLVGLKSLLPRKSPPLTLADLRGLPLLHSPLQSTHATLTKVAEANGVELTIIGGVDDHHVAIEFCASGMGVMALPETIAHHVVGHGELHALLLDAPELTREIFMVSNPDIPKTGAVTAVEAILVEVLTDIMHSTASDQLVRSKDAPSPTPATRRGPGLYLSS